MDWSVISICQGIGLILSFWALFRDEVDKYVLEESYKENFSGTNFLLPIYQILTLSG